MQHVAQSLRQAIRVYNQSLLSKTHKDCSFAWMWLVVSRFCLSGLVTKCPNVYSTTHCLRKLDSNALNNAVLFLLFLLLAFGWGDHVNPNGHATSFILPWKFFTNASALKDASKRVGRVPLIRHPRVVAAVRLLRHLRTTDTFLRVIPSFEVDRSGHVRVVRRWQDRSCARVCRYPLFSYYFAVDELQQSWRHAQICLKYTHNETQSRMA